MSADERSAEQYEWVGESRAVAEFAAGELRELVELAVPNSIDGHAYSSRDLSELRKVLSLTEITWPDAKLHSETDRFAAMIGLNLRSICKMTPGARRKEIARSLLRPAVALRDNLRRHGELIEADNASRASRSEIVRLLDTQLLAFIEVTRTAFEQIEPKNGVGWSADFKRYYVRLVTMCPSSEHLAQVGSRISGASGSSCG